MFNFFSSGSKGKIVCLLLLAAVAGALVYFYNPPPILSTASSPSSISSSTPSMWWPHTRVASPSSAGLPAQERALGTPQDRLRHGAAAVAYGLMLVGSLSIVGTNAAVSPNWLISHLSASHLCRTSSFAHGHIVCQQGGSSQAQRLDDGWLVCCYRSRQLSCVDSYAPPGVKIPVWDPFLGILIIISLCAATFIFAIMKKLEAAHFRQPCPAEETLENVRPTLSDLIHNNISMVKKRLPSRTIGPGGLLFTVDGSLLGRHFRYLFFPLISLRIMITYFAEWLHQYRLWLPHLP